MAELVSRTYSEALFEVAVEEGKLDKITEEVNLVVESFKTYPDLFELFKSPQISIKERKAMVTEVFEGKISTELLNFLKILIDKGRGSSLFGISDSFIKMADGKKGLLHVIAESAVPMGPAEIEALRAKLSATFEGTVEVSNKLNPDLMGGLVLKIGDKIIDGSVKKKLDEIKDELAQIIV